MATQDIEIRAILSDELIAADVEHWLSEKGATDVIREHQEGAGFLPLLGIILACSIGSAALAELVLHIRDKFQCQQIIRCTDDAVDISTQCDHRNGKIIVVADEGVVVSITDPGKVLDITEVAKTAVSAGADAAKALVEGAGGKATVEPQAT